MNLFRIVDAVLHAHDQRTVYEVRRDRAGGRRVIRGLDAKQHDFCAVHGGHLVGCFDADFLLQLKRIEKEPAFLDGLDEGRPPDQDDRRARAGQQTSEISADGARADNGNPGPRFGFAHGVITLTRRSMSRSVLYRCGETRMLPSRKLTMTFSLRRRW